MTVKKGGAGGRAWGKPGDEMLYENDSHYLGEDDPNFDPVEEQASVVPDMEAKAFFVSSAADLKHYKTSIKAAVSEYVTSEDTAEFKRVVVGLDMTVYHQELTKIIVTKGLGYSPENRAKLSHLLAYLHTEGHLTPLQSKAGFLKIYHRLDEVMVDSPNALSVLKEFQDHAVSNGFLDNADLEEFDAEAKLSSDQKALSTAKQKIKAFVAEYLVSEDIKDTCTSIEELKEPQLGYEVVKRLIYAACDGKDRARELVSVFLAEVPSTVVSNEQIAKGFSILLERTEDMLLDTPDIFDLMSVFIARAVVDEALPPAFVVRQDLTERDMGFQVVTQAQRLLKAPQASQRLADVWGGPLTLI